MRRLLNAFAFFVVAVFCAMPMQLLAQAADTLDVAALPAGNINTVIGGDTLVGNLRAHPNRIYRLKRTSVYQITAPMRIKGNIKIVATDGTTRPPVLAPAILADNSSVDTYFDLIGKGSNVEMSNVYMLSVRSDQAQLGWSTAIQVNADSITMKLRGVVFDAFSSACIRQFGRWSKLDVQDCKFRNSQHSSSWFGGQPFLTDGVQMDTCKFINNTFFANNSYIWSIRGYDRLSVFSHNTIVYGIVNPFLNDRGYNMHMNNNLFYGAHSFGGNPVHIIEDWMNAYPDSTQSSIILLRAKTEACIGPAFSTTIRGVEALIDSAHGVTADMVPVAGRRVEIRNNAYLFPPKLVNFVKAYNDTVKTVDTLYGKVYKHTIAMARWMNDYELTHVNPDLLSLSPKSVISNNSEVDPGFNSTIVNFCDSVNAYCRKISTDKLDKTWLFNPNGALYPPVWPIPEDLSYTNTTLQKGGTDGFAVGDLNWFPTQKSAWLLTDVADKNNVVTPGKFELTQNYPNPFNPSTTVNYSVKTTGVTTLKVYNIIGQEVATLVNGVVAAGSHQVTFNASRLSSGVYLYTLRSGSFVETKKMSLLK